MFSIDNVEIDIYRMLYLYLLDLRQPKPYFDITHQGEKW